MERQNFLNEVEAENQKFLEFKEKFEELLLRKFGITINDCTDEEQLRVEFETGSTPEEFVDFIGDKHGLDFIDDFFKLN